MGNTGNSSASEVTDVGEEPMTIGLLNRHNPYNNVNICLCTFVSHQRNFSAQQTDTITETHNQCKHRIVQPSPTGYPAKTVSHLRLRKHCRRGGWKIMRIREFAVRLFPNKIGCYSYQVSPICLPKDELNNDITNKHTQWMGESPEVLTLTQNYRQLRTVEKGRNCLLQERHANWFSNNEWLALKTYM